MVTYEDLERESRKAGNDLLENTKKVFDNEQISVEIRLIEDEHPGPYIKKVVEKENFDLIVLGRKGHHSKLREILLGSVATKVLNSASCDVLIVQ